ncbi:MAG: tetratricopeptide repeat protein, partial [Nannocystaceae bacterium]
MSDQGAVGKIGSVADHRGVRQLIQHVALNDGFSFFVVGCQTADDVQVVRDALEAGVPRVRSGSSFETAVFAPISFVDATEGLLSALREGIADKHARAVFLDFTRADCAGDAKMLFHRLNENRNTIASLTRGALVLCVLPSLYVAFAEHARDFWSIRSFSFLFARRLDPHRGFHHEWQRSSGGMKSRASRARASGGDDLESLRREIAQLQEGQPTSERALAVNYGHLGDTLAALGDGPGAAQAMEEAVAIYRKLAEEGPEVFLPDFALSLSNLAGSLRELGRREGALAATEEAAEIRRKLAAAEPEAFLPDLGSSLNNLGVVLRELGRREEAVGPTEEAVEIRRKL